MSERVQAAVGDKGREISTRPANEAASTGNFDRDSCSLLGLLSLFFV
jgi:hypothetical protein